MQQKSRKFNVQHCVFCLQMVKNIEMSQEYDIKKKLGDRIKFLRKQKNFTQEFFAEKINIEPQSLSNIERGKFAPSIETLQKIATALCVQPYELYLFEAIAPIKEIKNELIRAINESDALALDLYNHYISQKPKALR